MLRGCLLTALLITVLVFFIGIFVIKLMWMWTVPDLFPGAVEQGLIAREIGWWTAIKLSIVMSLFAGLVGGQARKEKCN